MRAEAPGTTRVRAPARLAAPGRHNGAAAARWSGAPHGSALGAPVEGAKMPVESTDELLYDSVLFHVNRGQTSPESAPVWRKVASGRRDSG